MYATLSKDYETCPAGTYPARIVRVIHLGQQPMTWQGRPALKPQVVITWELSEKQENGLPFIVSRTFTFFMSEKARFRQTIEAWLGRKLSDDELKPGNNQFHTKKLLGTVGTVTIVHVEKGDNTYANVSSVSPLPKGLSPPEKETKQIYLGLDAAGFNAEVLEELGEKLKDKIKSSPDYKLLSAPPPPPPPKPSIHEELDDQIPF